MAPPSKRPSPDSVIDLCESDSNEEQWQSVKKRLKSGETPGVSSSNKKVKSEHDNSQAPSAFACYDDVEVVEKASNGVAASSMQCLPTGTIDGDISVVGTLNHVRLPHMRQHCIEKPFQNDQGYSLAARTAVNGEHCDDCYCYVCDVPVNNCKSWKNDHCLATDQGARKSYWAAQRDAAKTKANSAVRSNAGSHSAAADRTITAATVTATSARVTMVPPGPPHLRHNCPVHDFIKHMMHMRCSNCLCYVCNTPASQCSLWQNPFSIHCNAHPDNGGTWDTARHQKFVRTHGEGPFAADHEAVAKDYLDLTKCRHCGWYSRLYGDTGLVRNLKSRPTGCLDWCHACGRVASTNDLSKQQGTVYTIPPAEVDKMISLGTKEIHFTLRTHDPRNMGKFSVRWAENQGTWTYNETAQAEELYLHRFGSHPTLPVILGSIPTVHIDKLPTDGDVPANVFTSKSSATTLADEAQAVILDHNHDLLLLREINRNARHFGTNRCTAFHGWLFGDVQGVWDRDRCKGTFKVRCFVKSLPHINEDLSPTGMARFFGAWFGVIPFKLSDLHFNLTAHAELSPTEAAEEEAVEVFNACMADASETNFVLESGTGSKLLGGTHAPETDLTGALKRFLQEIVPDCVHQRRNKTLPNPWMDTEVGVASDHRTMRTSTTVGGLENLPRECGGTLFDSFLSREDYAVVVRTSDVATALVDQTSSLTGLMSHLENRGHAAAPSVDGLTVELLPFQSQSLQWAIERETVPGGLQSFFWSKLPNMEAYYNPILGKVSKTKPDLVRGGIIAEQMGLGKTVISLALILQNPAPTAPVSGSPVASIPLQPTAGSAFWDPDLYGRTSEPNKKRGSILSRGTLVVCNVSLVGQWIEEAKSKLKDPGLVYSYHGQGRNRNPTLLSANSIVVTTYETLASDATFHASKSKADDYCPPVSQVRWWRIICDESHVLRTGSNAKSNAVLDLVADNKWLVSGTPINTTVMDLKNQLKFLGIQHGNEMMDFFKKTFFSRLNDAAAPTSGRGRRRSTSGSSALEVPGFGIFTFFMRSVMMRHSQNQKYSGTSTTLMSLPSKTERVITVSFSDEERTEYEKMENAIRDFYNNFKLTHGHTISSHYLLLTQKLTPLRIACSGGQVPLEDFAEVGEDDEGAAKDPLDSEDEEGDDKPKKKVKKKPVTFSDFAFTSKLAALISELKRASEEDSTAKSLVFSQYSSTLKYLQTELAKHGYQFRTLSGDMSMNQRAKALRDFQNDPPTTVFLLSMRAGAVGINLTQANCVFLMEPCFNPALEAQAIGRVMRLGQTRNVNIVRLIMQDSVEMRIRTMLDNKYGTGQDGKETDSSDGGDEDDEAEATYEDEDEKPAAKSAMTATPITVGCIVTDKAAVMEDEFDLLFGVDGGAADAEDPVPDKAASSDGDATGCI